MKARGRRPAGGIRDAAGSGRGALHVEGLIAGYGWGPCRHPVLRGVTLAAPPGRVTAVVGPNGVGKTTLFRVVLGFLPARSGTVTVGGRSPARFRRRRGIGFLPERTPVPAGWTFRALAEEGCDLHGLEGRARRHALEIAFGRSGLDARQRDISLPRLSKGLARRAVLAFALLGEPDLVLLDEPYSGLDPDARARLRKVVAAVAGAGATVLLTSHELGEVARTADRAVVLRGGRVVAEIDRLRDGDSLERAVLRSAPSHAPSGEPA